MHASTAFPERQLAESMQTVPLARTAPESLCRPEGSIHIRLSHEQILLRGAHAMKARSQRFVSFSVRIVYEHKIRCRRERSFVPRSCMWCSACRCCWNSCRHIQHGHPSSQRICGKTHSDDVLQRPTRSNVSCGTYNTWKALNHSDNCGVRCRAACFLTSSFTSLFCATMVRWDVVASTGSRSSCRLASSPSRRRFRNRVMTRCRPRAMMNSRRPS